MHYLAGPVAVMLMLIVVFAPSYLTYSDVPLKSDAVVLFVGPGREERLLEAQQLIREGFARCLIIPASGETLRVNNLGVLERVSKDIKVREDIFYIRKAVLYKKYFEDTHVEALEAKRIMDENGLRSAILVSSPYHMRRIKLIAGIVFKGRGYRLWFEPTRYQASFTASDWLVWDRIAVITEEYLKMGWLMLYEIFD